MFKVNFHELDLSGKIKIDFAVMVARYQGKWVFCKHKKRTTWEVPGGHVEPGEDWLTAAKRELFEETGATKAKIEPVCLYSIERFGVLCFAEIEELGELPESEIEKIELRDSLPENLTYQTAHTAFWNTVQNHLKNK